MLFNTLQFASFFVIVYCLYRLLNHRWQNILLLIASYVFYGSWDWRFLSLILISTILDYFCGLKIYHSDSLKLKKIFLILSVAGNLTILGFFKYFNFFIGSLQTVLASFGFDMPAYTLNIILPVGISFYTFQTMSYTLDIYRGKLEPTNRFFDFALFVAFFPQLVAGPIERAKNLLPQVLNARKITAEHINQGCYLIFWGLFQKIFVADNLARIVDPVFNSAGPYNGAGVLIAVYAFAFQIFCDFAGYSNIARGLCKLMGFEIMVNFNLPYFATNPQEFWRRWHISLSTWLRDYLYIPLGGNRRGLVITYRNLFITMLLGGLWHGAAWNFVLWGAYHGLLLSIYRAIKGFRSRFFSPKKKAIQSIWFYIRVLFFFHLVCFGWLLFRAHSFSQITMMLSSLVNNFQWVTLASFINVIPFIWFLLMIQFLQFRREDLLIVAKGRVTFQVVFYYICFYSMIIYGATGGKEFIYFQF